MALTNDSDRVQAAETHQRELIEDMARQLRRLALRLECLAVSERSTSWSRAQEVVNEITSGVANLRIERLISNLEIIEMYRREVSKSTA